MSKKLALLVGCTGEGTQGGARSVAIMRAELEARGFQCRQILEAEAKRDCIIETLENLASRETGPDDAIVFYFNGHGGRCFVDDGRGPQPAWNYLVPYDHDLRTDFRGISDEELSLLIGRISAITKNVTVILDCCHSASLCRGDAATRGGWRELPVRSAVVLPAMPQKVVDNLEKLHQQHLGPKTNNAQVVRVVATMADSLAFHDAETGLGMFTKALVSTLAEGRLHTATPWDTLLREIRGALAETVKGFQCPEVEGPRERLPFSLMTAGDLRSRATLYMAAPRPFVDVGALHGVARGDRLEILGRGEDTVAYASVAEVLADHSLVAIELAEGASSQPRSGSTAVRRAFDAVDDLERARMLREALAIAPGFGCPPWLDWAFVVVVLRGREPPRELSDGDDVFPGDRIYIDIRHQGRSGEPIFVNLLDEGVSGRVGLLNLNQPSGVQLGLGQTVRIGALPGDEPGFPVGWPQDVDSARSGPLGERVIAVASLRPLDLRPLLEVRSEDLVARRGQLRLSRTGPLAWDVKSLGFVLRPSAR